jgi:hypothetical protein
MLMPLSSDVIGALILIFASGSKIDTFCLGYMWPTHRKDFLFFL